MREKDIHVVVENGMAITVLLQYPMGIRNAKVFEMKETVGVIFSNQLDEPDEVDHSETLYQVSPIALLTFQ